MALVEEARRIHERLNDREGGGVALSFLAQMTFAKGDHARALALYGEALESLDDDRRSARGRARALRDGLDRARRRRCALRRNAPSAWACRRTRRSAARAGPASRCSDSRRSRPPKAAPERAVAIAAAAHALSERAGIVIAHPMDPGVVSRIEALKASIPKGTLDGLVANASVLSPAAVLAMVSQA